MAIVCQINEDMLYQRAQKECVEFYKWNSWIEIQLSKEVINQLFMSKQQAMPENLIVGDTKKRKSDGTKGRRKSKTQHLQEYKDSLKKFNEERKSGSTKPTNAPNKTS